MIYRVLFILYCFTLYQPQVDIKAYLGKWEITGGSIIEIYQKGNLLYGKINKRADHPISNRNGLDNNNPNEQLKSRKLLGIDILENLEYNDGVLSGGTIYNADSGSSYTVKVWIENDNLNTCYIRAYKSILFKTFEATRIPNPIR